MATKKAIFQMKDSNQLTKSMLFFRGNREMLIKANFQKDP